MPIFHDIPKRFWPCKDGTYSDHGRKRACVWHGGINPDGRVIELVEKDLQPTHAEPLEPTIGPLFQGTRPDSRTRQLLGELYCLAEIVWLAESGLWARDSRTARKAKDLIRKDDRTLEERMEEMAETILALPNSLLSREKLRELVATYETITPCLLEMGLNVIDLSRYRRLVEGKITQGETWQRLFAGTYSGSRVQQILSELYCLGEIVRLPNGMWERGSKLGITASDLVKKSDKTLLEQIQATKNRIENGQTRYKAKLPELFEKYNQYRECMARFGVRLKPIEHFNLTA